MLILFSFYSYNVTGSFERNFVGYWSVALQYMTIYWFLVRSWGRKFVDKDTNEKKNNLKKNVKHMHSIGIVFYSSTPVLKDRLVY